MSQKIIRHKNDEYYVDCDVNVDKYIPSFHNIGFVVIMQS